MPISSCLEQLTPLPSLRKSSTTLWMRNGLGPSSSQWAWLLSFSWFLPLRNEVKGRQLDHHIFWCQLTTIKTLLSWTSLLPSEIISSTGCIIPLTATSVNLVSNILSRLPSRRTQGSDKLQDTDWLRWLPAIIIVKVSAQRVADSLRNIQTLLRNDHW